jgi:hypothetical protein
MQALERPDLPKTAVGKISKKELYDEEQRKTAGVMRPRTRSFASVQTSDPFPIDRASSLPIERAVARARSAIS